MERVTSGSDLGTTSRREARQTSEVRKSPIEKTNPRSRTGNRSARASEFAAFSDNLRRELDPRGPLERLMADHVVFSAWRLKDTLDRRRGPGAEKPKRTTTLAADREARSVRDAIETLDYLRDRRSRIELSASAVELVMAINNGPEIEPNEWPIVPTDFLENLPDEPSADEEVPIWQDRLIYDFDVSDISPVVKGTWITVGHVVSLIVDGWTWADILRAHPELTEDDIRTCVAYAVAEENTAA